MLLSSFFTRSMAFTHMHKVQLPFALFSETFLTIRQNSLYVTVCIIARPSYRGYFIHSLSTLHYCNAPSLATRLTGDYRDRTYTGKCGPASLDTRHKKGTGRHNSYVIRRLNDPVKSGAPNSHIDKQYTKLSEHLQAPIETFLPDCGMRTSRGLLPALNR